MPYKSNKVVRVKNGLGLIILGIVIAFIMNLVVVIVNYASKGKVPDALITADGIVIIVALVLTVLGALICLLSGQKHFTKALLIYLVLIVWMIIYTVLKKRGMPEWFDYLAIITVVLLCFAHLSILLALKEVSDKSKFNSFIMSLCILAFIATLVLVIVYAANKNMSVYRASEILTTIEGVLFFIGIFTTYLSIK